ncbi:MAG: hypothetical protein IV103_12135 [Zoogloea sp.]|nr:hypothetical protein [Zoogloea sp.]
MDGTRGLIERLYGRPQLELARPCLRSVIDRRDYAHYHFHEANNLFQSFAQEQLADSSLLEAIFGPDDDTNSSFDLFIMKVGAHVLACIQSLHSITDIMAHATYYSLGMNLVGTPLREAAISSSTVLEELEKSIELNTVHRLLTALASEGGSEHLAALSNYSKHRSIIRTSLAEDWTGKKKERHQLMLGAFMYKKSSFPETSVNDFVGSEFNRIAQLIVDTGNSIHSVLQKRAS